MEVSLCIALSNGMRPPDNQNDDESELGTFKYGWNWTHDGLIMLLVIKNFSIHQVLRKHFFVYKADRPLGQILKLFHHLIRFESKNLYSVFPNQMPQPSFTT